MIKISYKDENKYGRFFLATEAPPTKSHIHANTKVIDVKPGRGRKIDFTKAIKGDEDYETDEETPEEDDDFTDEDETDFANLTDDVDTEEEDDTDLETDDIGDDTDFTNIDTDDNTEGNDTDETSNTDNTGDDGGGDTSGGTNIDPDNVDTGDGDDTDFSNPDGEGEGGEETANDDSPNTDEDPNTDNEDGEKGPGLEYSSTRKYALFLNFQYLLTALSNYINKLENNIGDDINTNKILKTCCTKLREIKDLTYEYMLMKFEIDTYVKSLLFYQQIVVMIQSVFNLLRRIKVHKDKLVKNKKKVVRK